MPTTETQNPTYTCVECGIEHFTPEGADQCCVYFTCPGCGEEYHSETDAEECCQYECHGCGCLYRFEDDANRCCRSETNLHSYGYKPHPDFYAIVDGEVVVRGIEPTGEPYMGFELEMECNYERWTVRDGVDAIEDALGDLAYCKDDGSLEDGLEMVTHPGTIDFWRQVDWSVLDRLSKNGFRAWNTSTAGLHIHLGIRAFKSRSHFARFYMLFQRNHKWWIEFAGRHSDYALYDVDEEMVGEAAARAVKYFPFKSEVLDSIPKVDYSSKTAWATQQRQETARRLAIEKLTKTHATVIKEPKTGMRGAVNCYNSYTVEVRLFRPSLRHATLLACLESVHAAWAYTKGLAIKGKEEARSKGDLLSCAAFAEWVKTNRSDYPYLDARIDQRFAGVGGSGETHRH